MDVKDRGRCRERRYTARGARLTLAHIKEEYLWDALFADKKTLMEL